MAPHDPDICRRALREIREIAAVAVLDGSQMTQPEALQTIAAIAQWVEDEPSTRADCADVVRNLDTLTRNVDFDTLSDREAVALFRAVLQALGARGSQPLPFQDGTTRP